jgi:uncharacterized protein YndB with AHSA1/START domain
MIAMSTKDFKVILVVNQSPEEVFEAVNNVRGWWSEKLEGESRSLGDEFVYRHKDIHYSKQRLVEVVPGKKVVWQVLDSTLSFVKDKTEWNGTTISFGISDTSKGTELEFIHHGLLPEVECYAACSGGWNYYLHQSLLPLITTGRGKPDK